MADIFGGYYHEKFVYFKPGKDGGVDLAAFSAKSAKIIAQCKHLAGSDYRHLISKLKDEIPKVIKIKPDQYIVATSLGLSDANRTEIMDMFSPFILTPDDVWGKERINQALAEEGAIERRHFKLWLTSEGVLSRLLHSSVYRLSEMEREKIALKARLFVQGEGFNEALKILEDSHCCIIAGNPGIGKSTLAEMLCLFYTQKDFDIINISGDIREGLKVDSHSEKQIFYYDDFLGQGYLPSLKKNEDQVIIDFADNITLSHSKRLILTTREYILEEAKLRNRRLKEELSIEKITIDLKKYSKFDRAHILYNHLYFSNIRKELISEILEDRKYLNIVGHKNFNPRLMEAMTIRFKESQLLENSYYKTFMANLDNPSRIWEVAFDEQLDDHSRNAMYVLATFGGEAYLDNFEKAFLSFETELTSKLGFDRSRTSMERTLKALAGGLVTSEKYGEEIFVKFENPSVRDFVNNRLRNSDQIVDCLLSSATSFEQLTNLRDIGTKNVDGDYWIRWQNRHTNMIYDNANRLLGVKSRRYGTDFAKRALFIAESAMWIENPEPFNCLPTLMKLLVSDGFGYVSSTIDLLWFIDEHSTEEESIPVELLSFFRNHAIESADQVEEFLSLAKAEAQGKGFFSSEESLKIRSQFSNFCEKILDPDDYSEPQEVSSISYELEEVNEYLEQDIDGVLTQLGERFNELEEKEKEKAAEKDWDYDPDARYSRRNETQNEDALIQELFRTLN